MRYFLFFFMVRPPPSSTLFPYTTLFRSVWFRMMTKAPDNKTARTTFRFTGLRSSARLFIGSRRGGARGVAEQALFEHVESGEEKIAQRCCITRGPPIHCHAHGSTCHTRDQHGAEAVIRVDAQPFGDGFGESPLQQRVLARLACHQRRVLLHQLLPRQCAIPVRVHHREDRKSVV